MNHSARLILSLCLIATYSAVALAQSVPASVSARFGNTARPVVVRQPEEVLDGAELKFGPDLKRGGQILQYDYAEANKKTREVISIQAGTALNRAIAVIASSGGLGYVPSPKLQGLSLPEVATIPEDSPVAMVSTLVAPFGFRALVRNNTIELFGGKLDDGMTPSVLTYQLKHVRFGEIAESPTSSMTNLSSGMTGGTGGMNGGFSGGTQQSGGAHQSQVLAPQDLEAKEIAAFFTKMGKTVLREKHEIMYEPRTRTIVAKDLPPYLELLRQELDGFDQPQRKVMVHMQVLKVANSPERNEGVDYTKFLGAVNMTVGQLPAGSDSSAVTSTASSVLTSVGAITFEGFNSPGRSKLALTVPELTATLNLVRRYADVELLQETFLVAQDGLAAHKFVGQELFIVVPGTSASGLGSSSPPQTFQRLIGDRITFRPEISTDDVITASLKLDSTNRDGSDTYGGQAYPQFGVDDNQQFITARDGQTVVLSGYLKDQITQAQDSLPILGSIPVLGPRLFGNTKTTRHRVLTLLLLTMRIIDPAKPEAETAIGKAAVGHLDSANGSVNDYVSPNPLTRRSLTGLNQPPQKRRPDPMPGSPLQAPEASARVSSPQPAATATADAGIRFTTP